MLNEFHLALMRNKNELILINKKKERSESERFGCERQKNRYEAIKPITKRKITGLKQR